MDRSGQHSHAITRTSAWFVQLSSPEWRGRNRCSLRIFYGAFVRGSSYTIA
jgi:hypothetical protein